MRSRTNRGSWIGLLVAVFIWQLLVRPGVAVAIGYGGGLSLPLLVLAGAFGAVGAAIGTMAWNEVHDRSRGGR